MGKEKEMSSKKKMVLVLVSLLVIFTAIPVWSAGSQDRRARRR